MRLKHSCRSNTNNLGGGCDRRFRWHFLAHAGLLFSHLPSNDLDAILTACTARRTSSISQWCREKGRETGWGGGRNKWSLKEGDDIVIHHQITGCCWTSIQRNKGDTFFSFFVFLFFFKYIIWMLLQWHAVSQPPPHPLPPKKKNKTKHPNISHLFWPVAKELLRGPDRLTDRCWCAKNSSAKQNSTRAKVSIDLSATLHVIKLTPK